MHRIFTEKISLSFWLYNSTNYVAPKEQKTQPSARDY